MSQPKSIVFVSKNPGKIREARSILERFEIQVNIANLDKVEIQADTPAEVADYSAHQLIKEMDQPFILEDTGLFVSSLAGFPGPYSHFTFGTIGCEGVLKLLNAGKPRDAYFESAVAYGEKSGLVKTFLGRVNGTITQAVRGSEGFGFDPIFIPSGGNKTFGELTISEKSEISHRRRALEAFANWYTTH